LFISDTRLQPAFFVSLKQGNYTLTGINAVVKFEDVKVNRGQGYNPSTGVFTAPRKGLYHISCVILGGYGHAVHYQLNKNDALYTRGYSTKGAYTSSTLNVIVEMKKGDGRSSNIMIQVLNNSVGVTTHRFLDILCKNKKRLTFQIL
jgi:hypothetical protein